jgi:hypothetical protein
LLIRVDPKFAPFRTNPHFAELASQLGLPKSQGAPALA